MADAQRFVALTLAEAAAHVALRLGAARVGDEVPEFVLAQIVNAMCERLIRVVAWADLNLLGVEQAEHVEVPQYLLARDLNWDDSYPYEAWPLVMRGMLRRVRPTRIFLSKEDLDTVFSPPERAEDRPTRGPRAETRARVEAAMWSDIESGKITQERLDKMPEKVLAERYGASRDTVRKARKSVLSVDVVSKPVSKRSKPESKLSKPGRDRLANSDKNSANDK